MKQPTLDTDQSANKDLLDRRRFSKNISESILNHVKNKEESLVIGIHGAWGSGKSTLLNFIKEDLTNSEIFINAQKILPENFLNRYVRRMRERWFPKKETTTKEKKLFIMEFNPWMFSGKEQLHRNFLSDFARKVGSKAHGLREKLERISGWVSAADSTLIGAAGKKTLSVFASISLEELKDETNNLLLVENTHVVIIMDDLDRLAPSEILEVFQLVKLNANFKNTLFLLSFDKNIVKNSIAHQYNFDGEKYLEKIIQVDYSLPYMLPEEIESMFFKRLNDFLLEHNIEFDSTALNTAWLFNGVKQYFNNIRDLNRFFNSLGFRLPPMHKDINVHDFILIEVLRLFDFSTYELIKNNWKESLQFGENSHHKKNLAEIIEGASRQLYKYLMLKENQNSRVTQHEYRIYNTDSFDRYFSLTISKKDLREEEFSQFILHSPARYNMLENAIRQGKIEYLLRRLGGQSDYHNKFDFSDALNPLFSVWAGFNNEFAEHWREAWTAIKSVALTNKDNQEGIRQIIYHANMSTSEFSPARFVVLWLLIENATQEDVKNTDPDLEPYRELILEEIHRIESSWKMLLENQHSFFLHSNTYPILFERMFLPAFATYIPEKYEQQFKQVIQDNQKVFKILNMFLFRDSISHEPFGINTKHVNRLLPGSLRNDFVDRLKSMNQKIITQQDAKSINAFLHFMKTGIDPLIGRRADVSQPPEEEVTIMEGEAVGLADPKHPVNLTINSNILDSEKGMFSIWGYVTDLHNKIYSGEPHKYLVGYATNGGNDLKNPALASHPNTWSISRILPTLSNPFGQWRFDCNGTSKAATQMVYDKELSTGWHLFTICWSRKDDSIVFLIDRNIVKESEFNNWPSSDDKHSIRVGVWANSAPQFYFNSKVGAWQFDPRGFNEDRLSEFFNNRPN